MLPASRRAGSKVLVDAPPASTDAAVVRRLRAGGAVIVAKTNMVEFAFSGIGLNPHYGTPGNPADRTRVPGGSSSGAAVAVADGMCEIAIGIIGPWAASAARTSVSAQMLSNRTPTQLRHGWLKISAAQKHSSSFAKVSGGLPCLASF
jgi:hypothetical protein